MAAYELRCQARHPRLAGRHCEQALLTLDLAAEVVTIDCRRRDCKGCLVLPLPRGVVEQLVVCWRSFLTDAGTVMAPRETQTAAPDPAR